ncbi:MAG: hypothetical protein ACRCY9_19195, partial [Phycicoccus sp.]
MTDVFSGQAPPPSPDGVRSYDELAAQLQQLRAWSGLSYRALHREVMRARRQRRIAELPAFDTVHRCLQPGRSRIDIELVVDIAAALLRDRDQATVWRHACQAASLAVSEASLVTVLDTLPPDEPGFTGRQRELAQILEVAGRADGP